MPVLPSSGPAYDPVETILQFVRVIANDCAISLAGNLLSDTQPYTFPILNLAWRKLQDKLGNNSIESFPQETILSNITPVAASVATDPGVFVTIDFTGYNDGAVLNASPTLPPDLEIPLKLWERPFGMNAQYTEMKQALGGLQTRAKTGILGEWEWRDDILFLVGALKATDIRFRYKRFLPDMTSSNPSTTPIPIIRCAVPLAYYAVEIFATPRGATEVILARLVSERDEAIKQLINSTTKKNQRVNIRRQPYSRRNSGTRIV